jgi:hypothetical protein
LPTVQEFIAIAAPREAVFDLIRDQSQRARFLPDGWRFLGTLSEQSDGLGSQMEVEWQIGPRPLQQVIETLAVSDNQVIEGPPGGDNYVTTWTVGEDATATLIGLHMRFEYGDFLSEFFVKRRLHRAFRQQLQRLKQVAECDFGGAMAGA